jgi:hypothetical protein
MLQVDFYNREINDEEEKKGENDSYFLNRNQNTIYDLIKQRSGAGNLMRTITNKGKA